MKDHPTVDGKVVGEYLNLRFKREWSFGSEIRIGNSLHQWALWVLRGKQQGRIPEPPGRIKAKSKGQLPLFQNE